MSKKGTIDESGAASGWGRCLSWWPVVLAILLACIAYSNAISGDFVYDDTKQIVENRYIQEGQYTVTALTSDVWSYKGDRGRAWSNYWRPAFVSWLMVNYRLFGLEPAGWHVTNIALHCVVVLLAWVVLRRLGVAATAAGVIVWLFAVHPVHVESVTWISGSPDMLVSIFLLASFAVHLGRYRAAAVGGKPARRGWGGTVAALALYALATLCKEVSVLFPALIMAADWVLSARPDERVLMRLRRAVVVALPFVAIAAVFLIARTIVLGMVAQATPWAPSAASVLLTMPELLFFYVRQVLVPIQLAPDYPLRAVTSADIGLANFALPVAVLLVLACAAWWLWRRGGVYGIGLALFLLPLAPAMNIAAFLPEQMVHDRYLYLPLLGALLVTIGPLAAFVIGRSGGASAAVLRRRNRIIYVVGLGMTVALSARTYAYNRAWLSEVALWECGVAVDPDSAHMLSQLGHAYLDAGRVDEAKAALSRAIEINPGVTSVILDLADIARREGRLAEAEEAYRRVLSVYPDSEVALDQLARTCELQGKLAEARRVLEDARSALPYRRLKYTMNVAVLSARLGESERALTELESIHDALAGVTDPELLRSYYFLGELYHGAGRTAEARQAYQDYIAATSHTTDPGVASLRDKARRRLSGE